MPRSPKDNQDLRETRRDEILTAARCIFADKGFVGAKIADIAAEAGLSHGLVYHYFETKEAILLALVESVTGRIEANMLSTRGRAIERIRSVIRMRCAELAGERDDPAKLVVHAALHGSLPPTVRAEIHAHFTRCARRLRAWIVEAQAAGDIDDAVCAEEIMRVMSYLLRGMSIQLQPPSSFPLGLPSAESILELVLPSPRKSSSSSAPRHSQHERRAHRKVRHR